MQKISIKSYGEREVYDEALKKLCFVIAGAFHQNKRVLIFLSGGSSVNLYAKLADWIASTKGFGGNLGRSRKQHEQMLHLPRATKERNLNNMRSEERRVGKECRSRWAACHLKKKRGNEMEL